MRNKVKHVIDLDNGKIPEALESVPFVFELITSLLNSACRAIDPVLTNLGGYDQLATDKKGLPIPPQEFHNRFSKLSVNQRFNFIGSCVHATTNLGLAFAHSLHLLLILTAKSQKSQATTRGNIPPKRINMVSEYDKLHQSVKNELNNIDKEIKLHDFNMQITTGKFEEENPIKTSEKDKFRQQLEEWDRHRLLQDSHMLFSHPSSSVVEFMIPLRSILILDRIIDKLLSPRLGLKWKTLDNQLSRRKSNPSIKWDGTTVSVSLPDKLDQVIDASWSPNITSVVRIRELGKEEWSPGFETIFSNCSFVDLKPDTEYEMMVTHKNEQGEESEPSIVTTKTAPEK
ncbi:MAG: fibronectin type III domain-containing protein [Gammaproteobacteria bacterium]|nr:fibronectin type III domain-containing protein [Gammaproteobacteria bacterium]